MSSAVRLSATTAIPRLLFQKITQHSPHFSLIEKIFNETVIPLWGGQKRDLRKIKEATDRTCHGVFDGDRLMAFIVYKNTNQDTHSQEGITNSLEVKQFVVIDENHPHCSMHCNFLLTQLLEISTQNRATGLHLIVSDKESSVLRFLQSNHFQTVKEWDSSSTQGLVKRLLHRKLSEEIEKSEKRKREELPTQGEFVEKKRGTENVYSRPAVQGDRDLRTFSQNLHEVTLKSKYLQQIKSGKKTIEGRINAGMVLRWRNGDRIKFFCGKEEVFCQIRAIRTYGTFRDMLNVEGFQKCLTDVKTLDEAVRIYDQIPGYADRAARSGVAAIEIALIK